MTQSYSCPECKDTGVYQGLNTVEPCRACGGRKDTGLSPFGKPIIEVAGMDPAPNWKYGQAKAFAILQEQARKSGGQSIAHETEERIAESVTLDLKQQFQPILFSPEMVQDFEASQVYQNFINAELCRLLGGTFKPFDEIMPAELEGIKEDDRVRVVIECSRIERLLEVCMCSIDRPLFGMPKGTFFFDSIYIPGPESGESITGVLTVGKPPQCYFHMVDGLGWEPVYRTDPCSDMLLLPIVEDE